MSIYTLMRLFTIRFRMLGAIAVVLLVMVWGINTLSGWIAKRVGRG